MDQIIDYVWLLKQLNVECLSRLIDDQIIEEKFKNENEILFFFTSLRVQARKHQLLPVLLLTCRNALGYIGHINPLLQLLIKQKISLLLYVCVLFSSSQQTQLSRKRIDNFSLTCNVFIMRQSCLKNIILSRDYRTMNIHLVF